MRKTARAAAVAAVLALAILALAGCAKGETTAEDGVTIKNENIIKPNSKGIKKNSPLGVVDRLMKAGLNDDMDTFAKCLDPVVRETRSLILSNKKYLKGKQFFRKYLFGTEYLNRKGEKTFSWELGKTDWYGEANCTVTIYARMGNSEEGAVIGDTQFHTALFGDEWLVMSDEFWLPINEFLAGYEDFGGIF